MRLLIESAYVSMKASGVVRLRLTSKTTILLPIALNPSESRLVIETIPAIEPLLFEVVSEDILPLMIVCLVS
jgi:hypothetical protein